MAAPSDNSAIITVGGTKFRLSVIVIVHAATMIFTGGMLYAKLDGRITRLEEQAAESKSSQHEIIDGLQKVREQLARIETKLEERKENVRR
jgi:hypothetical protein